MPPLTLINKPIDKLPRNAGKLKRSYPLPIKNLDNGVTEQIMLGELMVSETTEDYTWLPGVNYSTGDIRAYKGQWWSAVVDNVNIVPGTEIPTQSVWALEVKSGSGVFYNPGVFPQDKPIVWSDHKGYTELYALVSETRPFKSVNIYNEEKAGDWVSVTEYEDYVDLVEMSDTFTLDFTMNKSKIFSLNANNDYTWLISNEGNAQSFTAIINGTAGKLQTLPENFSFPDSNFEAGIWTIPNNGVYIMKGISDGTNWFVYLVNNSYF